MKIIKLENIQKEKKHYEKKCEKSNCNNSKLQFYIPLNIVMHLKYSAISGFYHNQNVNYLN